MGASDGRERPGYHRAVTFYHAWLLRHRAALLEHRDAVSASYDFLPVPPSVLVKKYLIAHPDARGR